MLGEPRLTASEPIKLQDAPAHFLEVHWLRLIELKGSEASAIEALALPDPAMIVFLRRQLIEEGLASPDMLAGEAAYQLVKAMVESFRKLGTFGQIIGKGIYLGTGLRQVILPELWADLKFDFEANAATSRGLSYSHITVEQAVTMAREGDLVSRIVTWLDRCRLEKGEALKKTLAAEARVEFGSGCTESLFNEAYKQVYQRRRGRPRASEK